MIECAYILWVANVIVTQSAATYQISLFGNSSQGKIRIKLTISRILGVVVDTHLTLQWECRGLSES